jgi:hypothetical protein
LFIGFGIYLCVHIISHEEGCNCTHHHDTTCVTTHQ